MNVNYFKTLWKSSLMVLFLCLGLSSWGQVALPDTPPYTQDFNVTPGNSGTNYPTGWISYNGTSSDTSMTVGTNTSSSGSNYNYGSKIGILGSGSAFNPGSIVLELANTTSKTGLKISYDVIKIREQGRSNSFNLEISTTSATSGFTAVPGGAYSSGSIAEGTSNSYVNLDISTLDNQSSTVWIRWYYSDEGGSGSRDGIALDNVSISWSEAPTGDHTITVIQPAGGEITPGTTGVDNGEDMSFTATAESSCYVFSHWVVDGVDAGNTNPYEFTNVTADYEITAVFNPVAPYEITATAGANGSITPNGTVEVNCGADQAFTITPDAGYAIADVLVNGVSVGAVTTYTFENVTENQNISVSFEEYTGPCVEEDFSGIANSNNYGTRTWTGTGGTWTATDAREDQTINGKAITIRNGVLTSPEFMGGVESITMTTRLPFSDSAGNLIVKVNDIEVGTISYSSTTQTSTIDGININGNVVVTVHSENGARVAIDDLEWTCYSATPSPVTWTTDNEWSNVTGPTINDDVVIEGDLFVGTDFGSFSAKTLTVENDGTLYIESGNSVTVAGVIDNQAGATNFIVESDAILIQTDDVSNTGAITMLRDANPMKRLDYTLWSSPVSGMPLNEFSDISNNGGTGTIWNRVYELGAAAWTSIWESYAEASTSTDTFATAKGYLYRAFNSYDPVTPVTFTGEFTGVPNNGTYDEIATPFQFNAIGNPYPSPIEANDFINGNTGVEAVYFWTNVNSSNGIAYNHNNWASYTTMGGAGVADVENGGTKFTPANDMHIQPGQGFVVAVDGITEVEFNNSMRVNANGDFFRQMSNERHRFWLNLSNEEVVFNQILVGYMENATQGIDTGIDAKMFAYEGNALYSVIENSDENYVIQGRALPFEVSDVVTLGFRAVNAGSFTISLDNVDGLFADNQNIYLKDNYTQAYHNLKDGAYSFVSEEGVFNTRFEVVYQTAMSVENPVANNANWVVYSQENGFQVQTQGFELKTVQVYDLLGRTIYTANAQGTAHNIPSLGADSVYIVKVTTTENVVLSKKVK